MPTYGLLCLVSRYDSNSIVPSEQAYFADVGPAGVLAPERKPAVGALWVIGVRLARYTMIHRGIRPDCFAFIAKNAAC